MMSENLIEVLKALIEKTKRGKAIWNKTSGKGEFKIMLSNNTITISEIETVIMEKTIQTMFSLTIYDRFGSTIDTFTPDKTNEEYQVVKELYNSVTDHHDSELSETYQSLFEEVKKKEVVGSPDTNF